MVKDTYENIRVCISSKIDMEKFIPYIRVVKLEMERSYKKRGIYVHISIFEEKLGQELEGEGFKLYQLDRDKKTLIYLFSNNRAIPYIDTVFLTSS